MVVSSRDTETLSRLYEGDLVPLPVTASGQCGPFLVSHPRSQDWLLNLGVATFEVTTVSCFEVCRSDLIKAAGLCIRVERPPLSTKAISTLPAVKIKLARKQLRWCTMVCKLLEGAALLAYDGKPSCLALKPVKLISLRILVLGFNAVAPAPQLLLFHVEFKSARRAFVTGSCLHERRGGRPRPPN